MGLARWFEATPSGCGACQGTGYDGRAVIADWLETGDDVLSRTLTARVDARKLRRIRADSGMMSKTPSA